MIYEFQGIKPVIHPSAFVRNTNCIYKWYNNLKFQTFAA